jgi:hypothetical protein
VRIFLSFLLAGILISTLGCGGHTIPMDPCTVVGLIVTPASATANHAAAPPANAASFGASSKFAGVCGSATAVPPIANWAVTDPSVHLSPAQGSTTTATCTAALASPVTVTGTNATPVNGQTFMGTATLTCN